MISIFLLLISCKTTMVSPAEVPKETPIQEWSEVLTKVVTPDGYVDYTLLEENRDVLEQYVAWISNPRAHPKKLTRVRFAFWLNAYNALVLYQIIHRGIPDSVTDVEGLFPKKGSGFFNETQFTVGADTLSLFEIKHERIRMRMLDYRLYAALSDGSRSSPPMLNEVYTSSKLQLQLRNQMRRWVNDPDRGIRIENKKIIFSPIFIRYLQDFEFWSGGNNLCKVLTHYADLPLKRQLEQLSEENCPVNTFEYDWSLNAGHSANLVGF